MSKSYYIGKKPLLLVAVVLACVVRTAFADSGLARHKKMYVVPTPGKVTIDGRLDDWDLSGQISTYVISETADMQGIGL